MRTLNLLLYKPIRAAKYVEKRYGGVEGGFPLGNPGKKDREGKRARRIGSLGEIPGREAMTQMNLVSPRMMTMNLAFRKMGAMTVPPQTKMTIHPKRG